MIAIKHISNNSAVVIDKIIYGMPDTIVYRYVGMGNDDKQYRARVYHQTEGDIIKTKIGILQLRDFIRVG